MKKTHSANIGGTVFQVEEDAYEKLQAYLQSSEAHFHTFPDIADIVADIEGRIAEQLLQRELSPQVVRMSDVDRVIEAMGRIEQFAEAPAGGGPATAQALPGKSRKLFRDPDHKVIAGVASGLAAYLGLPVLPVRIAFVLLALFFGTAVVVYLLLWALAPVASSTTDRLQMRGRPLNLASIDQGVRDGIASIPEATRSAAAQGVSAIGSLIHLVVIAIARAIKWVAGVFVVGIASLSVLGLTVMLVVALVNADAPPLHPGAEGFFAAFGAWKQVIKVLFYLVAAIPLALILATGLKLFWGANRLNPRGLAGLLGVWVVALLVTAAIFSSSYAQVRQYTDEYPVLAEARRGLETYGALLEPTAPLSAEQSKALNATLVAEQKRPSVDGYWLYPGNYRYGDPRAYVNAEEQRIKAREESNHRVIESAKAYLDAQQLAVMQEFMANRIVRAQADLKAWQERQEQRELERREREGR
jgi:phage shock protein PspC (stress-responsive transcriptional regulator)